MNYTGIIKRAWNIVWRYRILWLFGLLAGSSGGTSGGSSNYSTGRGDFGGTPDYFYDIERWFETNVGLIIAIAVFLLLIGLAFLLISIAAKGGLIYLVREADEDRPVRGGAGWSVGFRNWGRVFLIDLLLMLPFLVVSLIFAVLMIVPFLGDFSNEAATATAGLGVCGALAIGVPLLLVGGIVVGILELYATRFAVLHDVTAVASIGQAWQLFKSRFKDTVLMGLLLFGIGIAFGVAVAVLAAIFGVVGALASFGSSSAIPLVFAIGLLSLILVVPAAIYGAFTSAVWTLTFRALTEPERVIPVRAAQPMSYMPPVPSGAPAPAAPPAPPAPPSPPAAPGAFGAPIPPPPMPSPEGE